MGFVPENTEVTLANAEAVLRFLSVFEKPDFEAGRVVVRAGQMPCWNYGTEVNVFAKALFDNRWVVEFDWTPWQKEAKKYLAEPELVIGADLRVLRRLLTIHIRKDRFCDGHLATMVVEGHITSILKRIEQLKEQGVFPPE